MSSFQEQELEAIKKELNILKEEYKKIEYENKQQKILVEYFCYNIMEYLYECNNIKKTAEYFGCDIKYLYSKLVLWGGCSETLTDREDYNDYHYKFEGRLCEIYELESNDIKMRTLEKEELNMLILEYQTNKHSLYELADKYNIIINNLFRLLKENKLIEKESDAIGYNEFYKEYIGEISYNEYDIKTDLGLISSFYTDLKN
jgi:hypothetical protein